MLKLCRAINASIFVIAVLFLCSGCVGAGIETPIECPEVDSVLGAWGYLGVEVTKASDEKFKRMPTKRDFMEIKGEPDEIIKTDEVSETWVYKRKMWCGSWVGVYLLLPLRLPACEGVDYITFVNENAKHLKITGSEITGGFVGPYSGFLGKEEFCGDDKKTITK